MVRQATPIHAMFALLKKKPAAADSPAAATSIEPSLDARTLNIYLSTHC